MSEAELPHLLVQRARVLRKNQTQAERIIWERLRNRRLGGYKFRRQHVLKDSIVDFFCHDVQLIVEIDGPSHEERIEQDENRDFGMLLVGYKTLRFTNHEVLTKTDVVCEQILTICRKRRGQAHRNSKEYKDNEFLTPSL